MLTSTSNISANVSELLQALYRSRLSTPRGSIFARPTNRDLDQRAPRFFGARLGLRTDTVGYGISIFAGTCSNQLPPIVSALQPYCRRSVRSSIHSQISDRIATRGRRSLDGKCLSGWISEGRRRLAEVPGDLTMSDQLLDPLCYSLPRFRGIRLQSLRSAGAFNRITHCSVPVPETLADFDAAVHAAAISLTVHTTSRFLTVSAGSGSREPWAGRVYALRSAARLPA